MLLVLRGRPALLHQAEQMRQRLFVGAAFLFRELTGALIELRGELDGLVCRTPERDERGGEVL